MKENTGNQNRLKTLEDSLLWCLSLAWQTSKFYTIMHIGSEILLPGLAILASFIGKYIINLLAGSWIVGLPGRTLFYFCFSLFLIAILRVALQNLIQYCQSVHSELLNCKISISLMDHALSSDLEYFDNPSYFDKNLSVLRDSKAIVSILWNSLACISSFVSFLAVFLIFSKTNITYSLLMVMAAIPASIASAASTKALYSLSLEQVNAERKLWYYQSISIDRHYVQDLRLFGVAKSLKERYLKLWRQLFSSRQKQTRKWTFLTSLLNWLPEAVVIFVGFDIASGVLQKTATIGDYSLFTGLIGQLWGSISQMSYSIMQILDNQLRIENVKSLDNYQNHVLDKGNEILNNITKIQFENVTFSYPGTEKKVIDDVSLTINEGEKIAFVGLNGSGKSTLIKLLLRMYDPDSGVIKINDIDIRQYSLNSLRKNYSVYFQEMLNYSFSIRDNLTIADETNPDIEGSISKAIEDSCFQDVLYNAPRGLETDVTRFFESDGLELSGGQNQKLALARAFFRRHTAIILDEPSSNLDPKAENDIFNSLKHITDGRLTIFTSHRLSNVFLADRIIVMETGRILEEGTQEQLIRNNKRFAELFQYQQKKYSTDFKK
jgi:ABC-type multidrug transport system fused ATPase/permease subunit